MGLKNWLINNFFSKDIPKARIKEDLEATKADKALDDYIVTSQKRHQAALRTADKLLKGKLLQQQAQEIIQGLQDLDQDRDQDQDQDDQDQSPSIEDTIKALLVKQFLGGAPPAAAPQADQLDLYGEPIVPAPPAAAPQEDQSSLRRAAEEKLKTLSEAELKQLKDRGFI